jgi:LmbE family N-acetylglucosaminyl deacetylase
MADLEQMPEDWERGLAIVAHPDDLEYGAAGAIAVWVDQGKDIRYVLVTRGEAGIDSIDPARAAPLREAEQRAAAAAVGVEVVEFLDFTDGAIEHDLRLRRELAAAIRRHQPQLVITLNHRDTWGGDGGGGGWNTPDHRNVGRGVLDAVNDAGNRWIFPDLVAAGLDRWSGVRWVAVAGSPRPTHACDITAGLERAIASLEAHAEYLRNLGGGATTDARSFLTSTAEETGKRFGGRPATAFELFG